MEKCIFIGYPEGVKGWRFWNPDTKKVVISERADFDERYMYGSKLPKASACCHSEIEVAKNWAKAPNIEWIIKGFTV